MIRTHTGVKSREDGLYVNAQQDSELHFVTELVRSTLAQGMNVDPSTIINSYVSLKSKPSAILVGEKNPGKRKLIEIIIKMLTNEDSFQSQFLPGHAWWAARNENVALFTHAQSQLNQDNLRQLFENALLPENREKIFIVYFDRISPAEVAIHFSKSSVQSQEGNKQNMYGINFLENSAYPQNVIKIGNMDTSLFSWYDDDLISQTSVIYFPNGNGIYNHQNPTFLSHPIPNGRYDFLNTFVRNVDAAYLKFHQIVKDYPGALLQLLEVERVMIEHSVDFSPSSVTNEVVMYLSNAWTHQGNGLFYATLRKNLDIALDIAISQIVLPRGWQAIRQSEILRNSLEDVLGDNCSYSYNFIELSIIS